MSHVGRLAIHRSNSDFGIGECCLQALMILVVDRIGIENSERIGSPNDGEEARMAEITQILTVLWSQRSPKIHGARLHKCDWGV